jgi:hypothetical protein
MSDHDPKEPSDADDAPVDSHDSGAMRALLKRSLAAPTSEPDAPKQDLMRGVQRKLRQRSKGKFYADGWSTTQSKVSYALVAIIMLVLLAVVYFVLGPTGISAR